MSLGFGVKRISSAMSPNTPPTYLITAASGHIGQRLVPLLLSQAARPTLILPTNNPDKLKSRLNSHGDDARVRVVHGNVQDPVFLEETLKAHGVTATFVCLTGENELMVTLNFFDAMKRAETVKHLVYLSACGDFGLDAIEAGHLRDVASGHVLVKHIIEAKLRYGVTERSQPGGFSWTIIGPSLFFDNDLRSKESILKQGFFDEPLGSKGVSRVDPADIALATANALQDDGHVWAGKKIMIGSLETYTSTDTARLWSKVLGTEITAAKSDEEGLVEFEKLFRTRVNSIWARDMRLMYDYFEQNGFGMTETEHQEQVKLLGRSPASYEEFINKTVKKWKMDVSE
ncbi:NAD(P)-bd-dom domain-containing protein [Fusarium keratoplasticum]|uniref:NAD(P)-bd-dom domain-containing protein n=1 Tax=Fusarium keratoplasticum TaxID=1328300 RepID=A0ACC0QCY2_9HYPO|nr:NAD(P)-bd-dom domain-containing protein [Fusarium keratoplasticum]KAI8650491.1 NAD(P)-bd-dom domain-containing protein [Fusarium keratoplasticum]